MTNTTCAHPACPVRPEVARRKNAGDPRYCADHQPSTGVGGPIPGGGAPVGVAEDPILAYNKLPRGAQDFLDNCHAGSGYQIGGQGGIHPKTADALVDHGMAHITVAGGQRWVEMSDRGLRVAQAIPGSEEHDYLKMKQKAEQREADIAAMDDRDVPELSLAAGAFGGWIGSCGDFDAVVKTDKHDRITGTLVSYAADAPAPIVVYGHTQEEVVATLRAEAFLAGPASDEDCRASDETYAAAYRLSAARHRADASRHFYAGNTKAQERSQREAEHLEDAASDYWECDECGEVTLHESWGACTSCG